MTVRAALGGVNPGVTGEVSCDRLLPTHEYAITYAVTLRLLTRPPTSAEYVKSTAGFDGGMFMTMPVFSESVTLCTITA